jgi:hypothetical protein
MKASDMVSLRKHQGLLLMGPPKTGKTVFVASGSKNAGAKRFTGKRVDASDVVLINLDTGGWLGALDGGYDVDVEDLSNLQTYGQMFKGIKEVIAKLAPRVKAGEVNVVGIDLTPLNIAIAMDSAKLKFSNESELSTSAANVDWTLVQTQGVNLHKELKKLECLVVMQCHVRVSDNNPKGNETANAKVARELRSLGGQLTTVQPALYAGILNSFNPNVTWCMASDIVDGKNVTITKPDGYWASGSRLQNLDIPSETDLSLRSLVDMIELKLKQQ